MNVYIRKEKGAYFSPLGLRLACCIHQLHDVGNRQAVQCHNAGPGLPRRLLRLQPPGISISCSTRPRARTPRRGLHFRITLKNRKSNYSFKQGSMFITIEMTRKKSF